MDVFRRPQCVQKSRRVRCVFRGHGQARGQSLTVGASGGIAAVAASGAQWNEAKQLHEIHKLETQQCSGYIIISFACAQVRAYADWSVDVAS
jgi:hypothetical protein